jgi:stage II sporulation protein D
MTARSKKTAQCFVTVAALALSVSVARASGPVSVVGRGYGHGVGMSQYGAQGYALHGYSYARILAHYYPGTRLAHVSERTRMRVLVAPAEGAVSIRARSAVKVTDGRGRSAELSAGTYRIDGSFRMARSGVELAPAPPLRLETRSGILVLDGSPYRGALVVRRVFGGVSVVNDLSVEDYVRGVVAFEMPSRWAGEALRAQAVAARSYVLAELRPDRPFDVYPDTRSQMYGGVRAERAATDAAVGATSGQVLAWGGRVATTYYSSSSGGLTAAIEDVWPGARPVPYLRSVADPYDKGPGSPFTVSRAELATHLGLQRADGSREVRNRSGRPVWLDVRSGGAKHRIAGRTVAAAFGLRSGWSTISGARTGVESHGDAAALRRSMWIAPVPDAQRQAGETTPWPIAGLGIALVGVLWIELLRGPCRRSARLVVGGLLIAAIPTVPLGSVAPGSGPLRAAPELAVAHAETTRAIPADPSHAMPAPPLVASPGPTKPQPTVPGVQSPVPPHVANVPEPVPPATGEPIPAVVAPATQPVARAAPPASTTTRSQWPVSQPPTTMPSPSPPTPVPLESVARWHLPLAAGIPSGSWMALHKAQELLVRRGLDPAWGQTDVEIEVDPITEVEVLVSRGEGVSTEFERDLPTDARDSVVNVMKTVAAFANREGGTLLFGIDNDGAGVGLGIDDARKALDRTTQLIRDWVRPHVDFDTDLTELDGKRVLLVCVSAGRTAGSTTTSDAAGHRLPRLLPMFAALCGRVSPLGRRRDPAFKHCAIPDGHTGSPVGP